MHRRDLLKWTSLGAGAVGAYLQMKGRCEAIVKESGLRWTIFRPSSLVSPDDGPEGTHGARRAPPGQALIFGALHLANPHASMTAAVAIALEAGLMLAGFYLLTGRIWVSIGVHAAWNFTQGWVFGAAAVGRALLPQVMSRA